jgi:hypothetical protein
MSSSMETAMLLSDIPQEPTTWADIDFVRWQQKSSACPAVYGEVKRGNVVYLCLITQKLCEYKTCFGRHWGM